MIELTMTVREIEPKKYKVIYQAGNSIKVTFIYDIHNYDSESNEFHGLYTEIVGKETVVEKEEFSTTPNRIYEQLLGQILYPLFEGIMDGMDLTTKKSKRFTLNYEVKNV